MASRSTPVKRLNATLPEPLARFVAEITGEGGLYETPSEFVRDLIRRYMENSVSDERAEVAKLLRQSIAENDYSPYDPSFTKNLRDLLK